MVSPLHGLIARSKGNYPKIGHKIYYRLTNYHLVIT